MGEKLSVAADQLLSKMPSAEGTIIVPYPTSYQRSNLLICNMAAPGLDLASKRLRKRDDYGYHLSYRLRW